MNPILAALAAFLFFIILGVQTVDAEEVNLYWQNKEGTLIVLSNKPCETNMPQKMLDMAKGHKLYQAYGYEHVGTEKETRDEACWFSPPLPSDEEAKAQGVPEGKRLIPVVNILVPDGYIATQPMDVFKLMVPEVTKKELF